MQMDKNRDSVFKEMARIYVENLGEELQREYEDVHIELDTAVLDKKVCEGVSRVKKRAKRSAIQKYVKIGIPLAASVLLVFAITRWDYTRIASDQPTMERSDTSQDNESVQGEFIPISYPLPSNLSVVNQELDNGMTVYQLEDTYNDDVVMQLAYVESIDYDVEGMQEIIVNGESVYAVLENEYQKITFEKDGIVYILTCKYDINTLLPICENIL